MPLLSLLNSATSSIASNNPAPILRDSNTRTVQFMEVLWCSRNLPVRILTPTLPYLLPICAARLIAANSEDAARNSLSASCTSSQTNILCFNFNNPDTDPEPNCAHLRQMGSSIAAGGICRRELPGYHCPPVMCSPRGLQWVAPGSAATLGIGPSLSNVVTADMISSPSGWNDHSVCNDCSTIGYGLTRPLGLNYQNNVELSTYGVVDDYGVAIHTGGDGASNTNQWPLYINVDLSSQYPDGLALNQLQWNVNTNGFGNYEVHGRNSDGDSWTLITTQLVNGFNSGMTNGDTVTNTWQNEIKYTQYQVRILDTLTSAGGTANQYKGYAVFSWQWNRILQERDRHSNPRFNPIPNCVPNFRSLRRQQAP